MITNSLLDFAKKFLKLFELSKNGSIVANWPRLEAIYDWIQQPDTKLIITLVIGFESNRICFTRPYRGDIGATNHNKTQLLQLFDICFSVYAKLCKIKCLNLQIDPRYSLIKDAEIDDKGDSKENES